MSIDAMLRRRPLAGEDVASLNDQMGRGLTTIRHFWAEGSGPADEMFDRGDGFSASLYLEHLVPGLAGQIMYGARYPGHVAPDQSSSDDFISLPEMNPAELDYGRFCTETLPNLVRIFGAYRAVVETDSDLATADWAIVCEQSTKTGRDIDGRDSVFRIWPVCFFDEELCRRSFGIGAEEVVARARPECEDAYMLAGGAFLLVSSQPLTGVAALDALDARVRARLNAPSAAGADR